MKFYQLLCPSMEENITFLLGPEIGKKVCPKVKKRTNWTQRSTRKGGDNQYQPARPGRQKGLNKLPQCLARILLNAVKCCFTLCFRFRLNKQDKKLISELWAFCLVDFITENCATQDISSFSQSLRPAKVTSCQLQLHNNSIAMGVQTIFSLNSARE